MAWKRELCSFVAGVGVSRYFGGKLCRERDYEIQKKNMSVELLDRWMTLRDHGISIERYLWEKEYRKVAIYGMGMLGNHLYEELRDTGIELLGIDRGDVYNNFRIPVYKPDRDFRDVDLVIVTPLDYGEAIRGMKAYQGEFLSLGRLLEICEGYLYPLYEKEYGGGRLGKQGDGSGQGIRNHPGI